MTGPRLAGALLWALALPAAAAEPATLLQLADYVGVDYAEAVEGGRVVDPSEYEEMEEFAARLNEGVADLAPTEGTPELRARARTLTALIAAKAPPGEIAAVTREVRDLLTRHYRVELTPRRPPDLARAEALYAANCAACHGADGRGHGPAARGLDPPPVDFTDPERARRRSLFGLYNAITLGVDGTGMASFSLMPEADRWDLAFYVGGLAADGATLERGERSWSAGALDLRDAVTRSPEELAGRIPDGEAVAAWVRRHPDALFGDDGGPLGVTVALLERSAAAYREGRRGPALDLAVSAYIEGFELVEPALEGARPDLVRQVEDEMFDLRRAIDRGDAVADVDRRAGGLIASLREAESALRTGSLGAGAAFSGSLLILLREGLEAILILGAIIAILLKTGRRDALVYVHAGWVGALWAGVATWIVSARLTGASGIAREVSEGVTTLLAAAILFYAGFWMHGRLKGQRWSRFLADRTRSTLNGRKPWGLSLVAFLAVYREIVETILLSRALWGHVSPEARGAFVGGAVVATVSLVVLTWVVFRLGVRLPLRPFFAVSSAAMFVLAVILAGKGVASLQEAGKLPLDPIAMPRVELLGIYPNLQCLAIQLSLALAATLLVLWNGRMAGRGEQA